MDHGLNGRGVHEVEVDQVVDTHRLQLQDYGSQVCPLYLWNGCGQHLVPVGPLCVEPVTLTRTRPSGSPGSLLRLSLSAFKA